MEQHGNRQAFTLLNKLPAEELKQLLKEDLYREDSNWELVAHILAVLSRRETKSPGDMAAEVQAAWEDFNQRYRTPEGENRELYPIFPEKLRKTQPKPRRKPGVLAKRWNMVR